MAEKVALTIIVQGRPIALDAEPHAPLRTVIPRALAESANVGQPPENWELRDANGALLDLEKKIADFGFSLTTRLFLNLRAGVGGDR